jgi:hypothetical protein
MSWRLGEMSLTRDSPYLYFVPGLSFLFGFTLIRLRGNFIGRHDIHHNDIQVNDTQQLGISLKN